MQLVDDVVPYELMKLRLLNASHQALCYLGYLAGYRYAHEVCQDPLFVDFLLGYMEHEGSPTLPEVPGVDLDAYRRQLVERFANPEVRDTLARLCAESSDRIPKWLVPVINRNLETGGEIDRSALVVASWARYAEGVDEQGEPIEVVDRVKDRVMAAAAQTAGTTRSPSCATATSSAAWSTTDGSPRRVHASAGGLAQQGRPGDAAVMDRAEQHLVTEGRTLVAGVDSSTQSTKIVVCDAETGQVVRTARAPHPDRTEVDPDRWWGAFEQAAGDGILDGVSAIAVGGQQHGMVTLDEHDTVVRDALLWNDTRSAGAAARPDRRARWRRRLGRRRGPRPGRELHRDEAALVCRARARAAARVARVVLPHDWLTGRILQQGNGFERWTTDRGDASGTGYWSARSDDYRLDLLERAFGRVARGARGARAVGGRRAHR